MNAADIPKHNEKDAALYTKFCWWTGMPLGDLVDRAADVFPRKEAVVDDRVRLTYAALRDGVDRLAVGLMKLGIEKGDAVLLQLPNWAEYVYSYFALQKIGGIPVVLISGYKQLEVGHLGLLTQAKAWIVPKMYRKMDYTTFIGDVREKNPQLAHVISVRSDKEGAPFTGSLEKLLAQPVSAADRDALAARRPDAASVAHVIPSGGTTGLPKGIPRTHNDYLCNVEYMHKAWEMNTTDTALIVVPVGHNLAVLNVVGSVLFGFKLILLDSTKPEDICSTIQSEKVTYSPMVPSLTKRILEFERFNEYDLSSLKKLLGGGEPSTPELVREVYKKIGCTYINEFGMTEGLVTRTSLDDDVEVICNTVGKPTCPYNNVKILDAQGHELPRNMDGEMVVKGPAIFAGYLKNPEENKKSFTTDGYFRTGDIARIDAQRNLRITGRIKDLIIRGGENVSPAQVEELVETYPGVADVAVIGMPDKDLGERVCAYVRPAAGKALNEKEIQAFMESKGASKLLIPEKFVFVDTLPMTEAGKHDKKALREDIKKRLEDGK
jgi:2,3-dihydroxybenzoate-AMP ligase